MSEARAGSLNGLVVAGGLVVSRSEHISDWLSSRTITLILVWNRQTVFG